MEVKILLRKHADEGIFEVKKSPGEGLCVVRGCRCESNPKKMGLCHRHWQHRWRLKSPKKSAYSALRDHAKDRRIPFTISYDYFLGITDAVAFWDHSAESHGDMMTFDRVDATKGYEPGNLRVISLSENAAKSNRERHLPSHVISILQRKRERAKNNPLISDECEDANPF